MLWLQDDLIRFDLARCCQCGTCLAVCKDNAIFPILRNDGLFEIRFQKENCSGCGKCLAVCPAYYLPRYHLTEGDWTKVQGVFLGQAKDAKTSFEASSGGVARTLLKIGLDRGLFEQAYCLAKADHYPWAEGQYFGGKIDLSSIANSMYLPILVNKNLKRTRKHLTLLIIGTNCQLIGADLFFRNSHVRLIKVALLCKQQKTLEFTRFIARRLGVGINLDMQVRYRGQGWPGKMKIGQEELEYSDAAALPYGKRLWMVPGCRFCGHPLGWNADITLADPWGIYSKDKYGKTMILVRTDLGRDFLKACSDCLFLEQIQARSAKKSIDWKGIRRKQSLIPYYLGESIPKGRYLVARAADYQRLLYESILERVYLPRLFLRIMNRAPFIGDII